MMNIDNMLSDLPDFEPEEGVDHVHCPTCAEEYHVPSDVIDILNDQLVCPICGEPGLEIL